MGGYLRGTPVGYFELDGDTDGDIEIALFGILPQFTGQGIGGYLLTVAIQRAWERIHSGLAAHILLRPSPGIAELSGTRVSGREKGNVPLR